MYILIIFKLFWKKLNWEIDSIKLFIEINWLNWFNINIKIKIKGINLIKFINNDKFKKVKSSLFDKLVIYMKITINPPIITKNKINEIIDFFIKLIFRQIKKVMKIKINKKEMGWNLLIFDGIIIIIMIIKFKNRGNISIKKLILFIQKIF